MEHGSRTPVARWAQHAVLDHALRSTRGLPDRVARDRFDQIASDVWEQCAAADRRGTPGAVLAASLLWRTLRGLPADLLWRLEARQEVAPVARRAWTPLAPPVPAFDQTNGLIVLDPALPPPDEDEDVRRLLAQALASNAVNSGMVGGNL